jgi:ankyrin repeat protein
MPKFAGAEHNMLIYYNLPAINRLNIDAYKHFVNAFAQHAIDSTAMFNPTAIIYAAMLGHIDLVEMFIRKDVKLVNQHDEYGLTPLIAAVCGKNTIIRIIEILIEEGANIDEKNYHDETPLICAVSRGYATLVQIFITKGANVDLQDEAGQTALIHAVLKGHANIVKILLYNGAKTDLADNSGQTPLMHALLQKNDTIIEMLITEDAAGIDKPDNYDKTPLIFAAMSGHDAVVTTLLNRGAEIDKPDKYGNTPLISAAIEGHNAVVKTLLNHGAKINQPDNYGNTPLISAAMSGHNAVVKTLLNHGAKINQPDNYGETALISAAIEGHNAVVKTLLNYGAKINQPDNYGNTPLISAAMSGHNAVVKTLLNHGVKYVATFNTIANTPSVSDHNKAFLTTLENYVSQQDKQTVACFALALLASTAIAAIGVLALFSISCHWVICLAVAIVSCSSSSVFMALLCKQNAQRQTIDTTHEHTLLHRFLLGLINIAPAACVVFHMSSILCPPLLLVVIGIMSISLLSNSFYTREPNKIPAIMANTSRC